MQIELDDSLYFLFRELIQVRTGLWYPERKRNDLAHALNQALQASGLNSLRALYSDALQQGPSWKTVVQSLTIGETFFFRNEAQFLILRDHLLPELLAKRSTLRSLRFWCAGCATGEEPYSLAILLRELLGNDDSWHTSILATDINQEFLARAKQAVYGNWSFRQISDSLRRRYWREDGNRWRLLPEIVNMVQFQYLNLVEPSYPQLTNGTSMMDVIFCRNVTIYFDEQTTQKIVDRFYDALNPGGWLIVGHSEPHAKIYSRFEVHNFPQAVLYRKPVEALTSQAAPSELMLPLSGLSVGSKLNITRERRQGTGMLGTAPLPNLSTTERWQRITRSVAQQEFLAAEQELLHLLEDDPTYTPALLLLAQLFVRKGDVARAQFYCQQATEQQPLSLAAHFLLAQLFEQQGQYQAALGAYRRTVFLDAQFIAGLVGMARSWHRMGQLSSAQRGYRNVLTQLEQLPATQIVPELHVSVADLISTVRKELDVIARALIS